jgi:hypothetical protein
MAAALDGDDRLAADPDPLGQLGLSQLGQQTPS